MTGSLPRTGFLIPCRPGKGLRSRRAGDVSC